MKTLKDLAGEIRYTTMIVQPIATIATAAIGAATVILSAASISNIYETYSLVQMHQQNQLLMPSPPSSLSEVVAPSSSIISSKWKTIDEAVHDLSNMKKRDLVELFLHCDAPDIMSDIRFCSNDDGKNWRYDGYLLDNGPILTPVTNFITNKLFGRGQRWLGKAYMAPTAATTLNGINGIGKNRFQSRHKSRNNQQEASSLEEILDRTFDYSIESSALSSRSLFNRYASHRPLFSSPISLLWRGMVDELRVIKLPTNTKTRKDESSGIILLGMGYFTWSGGVWNLAPFCLVARRC